MAGTRYFRGSNSLGFSANTFLMAPVIAKRYGEWLTGGAKHPVFDQYTLARFAAAAAHGAIDIVSRPADLDEVFLTYYGEGER